MKSAKIAIGLLAVALTAAVPSSTFAGIGLLDGGCGCAKQKSCGCASQKSCGCATQKGHVAQKKHVVQKGHVAQKGRVHQKGHVAQKGGISQKGCGASKGGCGSCSICLPRVLPALLHGVDKVLNKVFSCHSCGNSKGGVIQKGGCAQKGCAQKGHIAQKKSIFQKGIAQKGKGCGCGGTIPSSTNPFVDDLQPPPILGSDAEARVKPRQEAAQPVSHSATRPTRSVLKTASSAREPRVLPAQLVSPVSKVRQASVSVTRKPTPVVRTSATTARGLIVPNNPLR